MSDNKNSVTEEADKTAGNVQPSENQQDKLKENLDWKDDLRFIGIFIVLFSLFRFFVFEWYIVPSSSMVPTLLIGDMPFVEKFAYGFSKHSIWFSPNLFSGRVCFKDNVKRGEVMVFKYPQSDVPYVKGDFPACMKPDLDKEQNNVNLIKRVIALPGDRVSVNNGVITVNGVAAELKPKGKMYYHDTHVHQYYELSLYEEKLPLSDAPVHTVAYIDEMKFSAPNHFKEITVPAGHYFVMGDNRDCSKDSRCGLGFIPAENLMGRAWFLVYSIGNGVQWWEFWRWIQNIRYSRIFKRII